MYEKRLGQLQPHLGIRWQQVQGQLKCVNHGLLRKMGHHYGGHLNKGTLCIFARKDFGIVARFLVTCVENT